MGDPGEFFLRHAFSPGKIKLGKTFHDRDQVNVSVRNFQARNHDTDPFARNGFPDGLGDLFSKKDQALQKFVFDIEDIVDLLLRDDERVAGIDGTDIKEGEVLIVFKDLVGGDLPARILVKMVGIKGLLLACILRRLLKARYSFFEEVRYNTLVLLKNKGV